MDDPVLAVGGEHPVKVVTPPTALPLMDQYANVFSALSEPVRIKILSQFDGGRCSCTFLEDVLPISKSTISYHIKILRNAQLLEVEKDGRYYNYRLVRNTFEFFVPGFLERLALETTGPI